jgi:hypothetical protein
MTSSWLLIYIYCNTMHGTMNLIYLFTPCSKVLLVKLTGLQLVKKFPHFMKPGNSLPHYHKYPPPASIVSQPNPVCTPHTPLPERGPGSSVGIATGYRLDGLGIESWWGRDFSQIRTSPGAHLAFCTMGTGSFLGVKRPGHGADHPPPPSAEVDNE